jgi:hypothetical protein
MLGGELSDMDFGSSSFRQSRADFARDQSYVPPHDSEPRFTDQKESITDMLDDTEGTMVNEDRPSSFGAEDQDKHASAQEDNFAALETREPTTAGGSTKQKSNQDDDITERDIGTLAGGTIVQKQSYSLGHEKEDGDGLESLMDKRHSEEPKE